MEGEVHLVYCQLHPRLIEEFNIMKVELEKTTGYAIKGGNPIISLIVADILKKRRENKVNGKKDSVRVEIIKVKGCKKNEAFLL
jgi:hypothetical protein